MKTENRLPKHCLTGKWKIESVCIVDDAGRKEETPIMQEITWEFCPDDRSEVDNNVLIRGILIECEDAAETRARYTLLPLSRRLYVERTSSGIEGFASEVGDDGFMIIEEDNALKLQALDEDISFVMTAMSGSD